MHVRTAVTLASIATVAAACADTTAPSNGLASPEGIRLKQTATVTMTILPGTPGDADADGEDANNAGVVIGQSGNTAVRWVKEEVEALPGLTGALFCAPLGIAANGLIAGACFNYPTWIKPVLWRDGQLEVLSWPDDGQNYALANDVNSAGLVVGDVYGGAVTWQNGVRTPLEIPSNAVTAYAEAVAENGLIAGTVVMPAAAGEIAPRFLAVAWDTLGALNLLPGLPGYAQSQGYGVSNNGKVAGTISTLTGSANPHTQAVRWLSFDSPPEVLPCLYPGKSCTAYDTNVRGEAAGVVLTPNSDPYGDDLDRAAFWTASGELILLDTRTDQSSSIAWGISDTGLIVGVLYGSEQDYAVVWRVRGT